MKFQKYINRLPALSLIALLLCVGVFFSSCEDDEEVPTQVVLESFGPSGVKHGEEIKFIGQNLDKVSSIVLPGVEVPKSEFSSQSSSLITLVVPETAQAGKVVLKTSSGDIESKSMLNFLVPVVIESITGEARPGSDITITGEMLNWIEEIVFPDGLVVTEFVSQSLNELVVTVPMEAQTGALIFKSGGTKPLSFASEEELVVTLPVVTSFSPTSIQHTDNLTITGTDLDLVTSIIFQGDTATEFVSQSATQIVVEVPNKAVKGVMTLKQASPIDVVTANELTIILPVGTAVTPIPAVPGVDEITIVGTNLDLVAMLTLPGVEGAINVPASEFVSQSAEEIVLALPEGAKAGAIKFTTVHDFSGSLGVNVVVPSEGPALLAITVYDDEFFFNGRAESWNGTADPLSTEQAYSGSKSYKFATDGDGGAKVVGTSVDASGMGVYVFSLYGGPGTDGKKVAVILGDGGADNWGNYNTVDLVEGEWTEYRIPLSNYPDVDLSAVSNFVFKPEGAAAGDVIYIDRIGFDPAGPAPLDYYIYDDALQNGWSEWDGWGHDAKDFANTDEVFHGSKAIKVTFNNQWGAIQLGSPATDVFSGYTTLSFRVYAPEAQDFIVQIDENADTYLSIPAGWSEVEIPIANLDGNDNVGELRLKNNNPNLPVTLYFDYIGLKR